MARRKSTPKPTPHDVPLAPLSAVAPQTPPAAPVTPEAAAPTSPDRMGLDLRKARNAKGLTPRQVEDVLRIKEEYLLALENGHYHLLPTTAHAKGFLRTYARYLGLEKQTDDLLARFVAETEGLPLTPQLIMPTALPEAKLPTRRYIVGGLVVAVLMALLYATLTVHPEAEVAPALPEPVVEETPEAALPDTPAMTPMPDAAEVAAMQAPVGETPSETPPANASGVAIRATDDVWVQVQDKSGATIFSRLMKKDEEIPAPMGADNSMAGLTLTTGNGAGIVLVLDGKATAPVGAKAEVVRGISLDPKSIAARLKAPAPAPTPAPKPAAAKKPAPKSLATIDAAPVDIPPKPLEE